ncbi:energy transducer TonB [Opitutus terrae]|uniref:TonB family protein n=1 Tax=Opitutus terrae (strain DSM 11246 / JCM 15787 / PB90-1) TaxID=452637 RepID=B1ZSL6_OPITP|nr:energy transducer TonB [Opitutus terrae]ACB73873.1 TonB family protein [Opitutus terrae PB90-1]
MKAVKKLVVLLSFGALLPLAASAKSAEEAYVESASKAPGVPVPVAVVTPRNISADYAGSTVELAFTVDTAGTPTSLKVVSSPDAMLAKIVMDAVKRWRFEPAKKNGSAVATNVLLPVRISDASARFAAN